MHYPGHKRERFLAWVNEGCPSVAVIEVNNETFEVPATTMLTGMFRCSDVVPRFDAEEIESRLGLEPYTSPRTYGAFAKLLAGESVA